MIPPPAAGCLQQPMQSEDFFLMGHDRAIAQRWTYCIATPVAWQPQGVG